MSTSSSYPSFQEQAQSFNQASTQLQSDTNTAAQYEKDLEVKAAALFATVPYAILYELIPLMAAAAAPIDSNNAAIQDDVINVDNNIQGTEGIASAQFNQVMEDSENVAKDQATGNTTQEAADQAQEQADATSFVQTLDLLNYEVNGGGSKAGQTPYLSDDTMNQLNTLLTQTYNALGIRPGESPTDAAPTVCNTVNGWVAEMTPTAPSSSGSGGSPGQIPTALTQVNQAFEGMSAVFTNLAPSTNAMVTADNSAASKLYRLSSTLESMLISAQKMFINNQKPQ